jgi:hypothetical protein
MASKLPANSQFLTTHGHGAELVLGAVIVDGQPAILDKALTPSIDW